MRAIYLLGCFAVLVCLSAACRAEPAEGKKPAATRSVAAAKQAATKPEDLGTRKSGEDWPQFLGPTGDSKSGETGIITDWPKAGPKRVWVKAVGTGYGMPAISRGRLFQFSRYGENNRLTCMNSETGEELWRFEYPTDYEDFYGYDNGPRCSPVVDDDRVYLFGQEGMLHCLRVVDGELLWKIDTTAEYGVVQNCFGVGSTPVVEGELLIVQIGGSPEESQHFPPRQIAGVKPNGTAVVAFDKFTGEERYRLGDELASYSVPALATIEGRRWCFVLARGGLLGFDPAEGKLDFHYPWRAKVLESVNASNPVVVGRTVFISETYGPGSSLLRVKPGGYEVVWADGDRKREKSMQTHWNTCVHHDGYLYGSSGRHTENAELRCIELLTGKVKWRQPDLGRSSLLYVDGHFVCLTEHGMVLLLKANPAKFDVVAQSILPVENDSDEELSRLDGTKPRLLHYPAWAAPILSHGLLYLRGNKRLACLELIPEGVESGE
ncbi:MAG TPA: PQQ-binding-like beta-propeller repeat protein [Pirellulales bacterium]|nr:PQQ-binding-like beta-propeller repeat protein [Pirellulales bacterium]